MDHFKGGIPTFTLRDGANRDDDKPFICADVKCTWGAVSGLDLKKIRRSSRKLWFRNLDRFRLNDDREVRRPQPSTLALVASNWSPVHRLLHRHGRDEYQAGGHQPVQVRGGQAPRGHRDRAE